MLLTRLLHNKSHHNFKKLSLKLTLALLHMQNSNASLGCSTLVKMRWIRNVNGNALRIVKMGDCIVKMGDNMVIWYWCKTQNITHALSTDYSKLNSSSKHIMCIIFNILFRIFSLIVELTRIAEKWQ
jgi:hypothetical protein